MKPETAPLESIVLRQPRWIPVFGILSALLWFGVVVLSHFYSDKAPTIWTDIGFGSFGFLGLYLFAGYFSDWHRVSGQGLDFSKPLTFSRGSARWDEVSFIRYSFGWRMFIVTLWSGQKVWLSETLSGVPGFARLALAYLPPERIEPNTVLIFQVLTGVLAPDKYNRLIKERLSAKQ